MQEDLWLCKIREEVPKVMIRKLRILLVILEFVSSEDLMPSHFFLPGAWINGIVYTKIFKSRLFLEYMGGHTFFNMTLNHTIQFIEHNNGLWKTCITTSFSTCCLLYSNISLMGYYILGVVERNYNRHLHDNVARPRAAIVNAIINTRNIHLTIAWRKLFQKSLDTISLAVADSSEWCHWLYVWSLVQNVTM